jgi:3-oxoacyl-[acyl-carrier protein] reductase
MFGRGNFEGKVALVTGASGNLGVAIVEKLLSLDCRIVATYQSNRVALDKVLEEHPQKKLLTVRRCDITNADEVSSLLSFVAGEAKKLDILVNSAGIYKDNLFSQMTLEEFDQVIKANLYGVFNVTKSSLPLLRAAKVASVVNISSVAGLVGSFGQANYSAAKAAIGGLTRTLASELTSKGIRVNAIAPGLIDSDMVKRVPRNVVRQALTVIPAQRLGTVAEVANVVAFLASGESSYIVGQTIAVDGGLVLR